MKTNKTVMFAGYLCTIHTHNYQNNRKALELVDEDGDSVAMATVNMPNHPTKEDEVFIKSYSENEGMSEVLASAGIIGLVLEYVNTGFVEVTKHKLLI